MSAKLATVLGFLLLALTARVHSSLLSDADHIRRHHASARAHRSHHIHPSLSSHPHLHRVHSLRHVHSSHHRPSRHRVHAAHAIHHIHAIHAIHGVRHVHAVHHLHHVHAVHRVHHVHAVHAAHLRRHHSSHLATPRPIEFPLAARPSVSTIEVLSPIPVVLGLHAENPIATGPCLSAGDLRIIGFTVENHRFEPEWIERTLHGVIANHCHSKTYQDLDPLDGGTVGIAHFAVGSLRTLYRMMDARRYFGDHAGKIPDQPYRLAWWRDGMRRFLNSPGAQQAQLRAWQAFITPSLREALRHGWSSDRDLAIAAGIGNSLGVGGLGKIATRWRWNPERTLLSYASLTTHKERRRLRLNFEFPPQDPSAVPAVIATEPAPAPAITATTPPITPLANSAKPLTDPATTQVAKM